MQHTTLRFFHQIVLPIVALVPSLQAKHQSDYGYRKFFSQEHVLLSLYAHLSKAESVNDLAEQLADPKQLTSQLIGQPRPVNSSTISRANANRSCQLWQDLFSQLYPTLNQHFKRLHFGGLSELDQVRLVDGSLFEALSTMLWASYSTTKNKLKGHFFLDLNGLPDKLIVSAGKTSERQILLQQIQPQITYVFDRGYNSYQLFSQIQAKGAYFVSRLLDNAIFSVKENLRVFENDQKQGVTNDQIIILGQKTDHETATMLRLITYRSTKGEIYCYLTNRFDLSGLTIVRMYLWRWEIETFFGWLKRHLVFKHWYSENENGVRIQLFAGLITYLLLRLYAATKGQSRVRIYQVRQVRHWLGLEISQAELLEYQAKLKQTLDLTYCETYCKPLIWLNDLWDFL